MNAVVLVALALPLAFGDEPPPASAPPCPSGDNRCEARHFERLSTRSEDPSQRALYLFAAFHSHLSIFDASGDPEDLCAARRALDRTLAVRDLSADERAYFARDGAAELNSRPPARCERTTSKTTRPSTQGRRHKAVEGPATKEPPPAVAPTEDALLPVRTLPRRQPSPPSPALSTAPADAPPPTPQPAPAPAARRGRPLVIAGGASIGVGLLLGGVTTFAGSRAVAVTDEAFALQAETHGQLDEATRAKDQALAREYRTMAPLAVATAIGSGAAIVTGAVLVTLGRRREAREEAPLALLPSPGGLAIRGRF